MQKTKKKSLQELNLSDNFLFGEVMCDEETCKTALEVILGREIAGVAYANKEKHLDVDAIHKGIRLDIFFKDEEDTIYSVEMQTENRHNIPKRSRHYQSVIDIKILPAGERDYSKLNDCMIIFICTFDLFGRGRYCYTFENCCIEEPDLALGDGMRKIFLNTKGMVTEGVSSELIDFLHYVENSIGFSPATERVKKISERVKKVKENAQAEVKYMTLDEYVYYRIEDGIREGLQEALQEALEEKQAELQQALQEELKEKQTEMQQALQEELKEKQAEMQEALEEKQAKMQQEFEEKREKMQQTLAEQQAKMQQTLAEQQTKLQQAFEEQREESRTEGEQRKLIELVCKKIKKGKGIAVIADELEESEEYIREICKQQK